MTAAALSCLLLAGCAAGGPDPPGAQEGTESPAQRSEAEADGRKEEEKMTEGEKQEDPEETARRVLESVYTIDRQHPAQERWDRVRGDLTRAYGLLFEQTLQQEADYEQSVSVGDCYRKEENGEERVLLFSCEIRMQERDWGTYAGVWWIEVSLQDEDGRPKVSSIRLMPQEGFRDLAVTA